MTSTATTLPAWTTSHSKRDPIAFVSRAVTLLIAAALLASVALLFVQALPVISHEGWRLVGAADWFFRHERFGALAMIYGTAVVALIALLLATPIALGAAICTSEYLPSKTRLAVKAIIELLAGIPSVVYGLLGVLILREWIFHLLTPWNPISGDTLLTAGVLLAIMILPTVMTLCDDALQSVPKRQRHAARGLGLNRAETILSVSLPQAWPGILAAALLGLGRAIGEMIAVFLVIGRMDNQLPSLTSLISPGQTLTTKLGGAETFIAMGDPLHWSAIMALGCLLLVMTAMAVGGAFALRHLTTRRCA